MKLRFFDFEVFPNWWCCTFGDLPDDRKITEDLKNNFRVVTSDDYNARDSLLREMKEPGIVVVGYNIKSYDLVIANAIYQGFTPEQVKIVNDLIINPGCAWDTKEHIRLQSFAKKKLYGVVYQDLFDDNDGSLKEKEAILGLNILESSVPFDKEDLTEFDKEDVIVYNKHDVFASMYYFVVVMEGYVKNKLVIGKKFNIPESECYMCTNAKLVAKALGAKRTEFADEEKVDIDLPEKIVPYCNENLPSKVLEQIRTSTKGLSIKLFNNDVDFGNGGIHSVYANNLYVEADDEYILMNKDAASYYPSMLIQFACLSRAVTDPSVFKNIYDERIYLKHKPDKTQEEEDFQLANKLVLNTTFGASGNKYLDLYDPYQCTRCCRVGQIFLASLACKMVKGIPNLQVIQTNTDGILVYFPRKYKYLVDEMGQEWSNVSGINMEDDVVEKIWQRDVNNYLLVKEGGKIKRKGLWLMETWTKPGYFLISPLTAYVSQKAAIKYLVDGVDPVETIILDDDLLDFCMTCKKGPTYRGVVQKFSDDHEETLFKCNRIIATTDTKKGMLYKIKMYKGNIQYTKMPNIPEHCQTMNDDLSTYNFREVQRYLDYKFYIMRTMDLLNIPWRQLAGDTTYEIHKFDYD